MALRPLLAVLGAAALSLSFSSCPLAGASRGELVRVEVPVAPSASASVAPPVRPVPSGDGVDLARETAGRWPEPSAREQAELVTSVAAGDAGESLDQGVALLSRYARPVQSLDPDRALVALAKETFVFTRPDWRADKLGYLRAGAVVARESDRAGYAGCPEGWYRIAPEGFVCAGKAATTSLRHPVVMAARRRPSREAPLPYVYGMSRLPPPQLYTRVPTREEQRLYEPDVEQHTKSSSREPWQFVPLDEPSEFALGTRPLPPLLGFPPAIAGVSRGRAVNKSGFAFMSFFETEGRQYGVTVDFGVLPLDRLTPVRASSFHGLELDRVTTLPVAFVLSKGATLLSGDPRSGGMRPDAALGFRQAVPITGQLVIRSGIQYLETRDGHWLRGDDVVRVDPLQRRPGWAEPGRSWIDVSILRQTLVAYEGTEPVYATLVSTGIDGIGDPKKTKSTIRGQFLIHTKHVSITMDGDEVGDEFDLRDVPYVQYFTQGYALHAAYWHDGFGRPRSHGCINLAPIDAQWLFEWTDPPVPEAWHGGLSLHGGTLINIHP
jgi:hypothetical protein